MYATDWPAIEAGRAACCNAARVIPALQVTQAKHCMETTIWTLPQRLRAACRCRPQGDDGEPRSDSLFDKKKWRE
jgi:hypothetical protein